MKNLLSLSLATLALGLFLMPQSASAAPSLDWDGKADITYQVPQSSFGFDVLSQSMNHGRKEARNAGRGLAGGVQLAIGIPISILGVSLIVPAIVLFIQADIALAFGGSDAEGVALLSRIGGVILLSIGLSVLIPGIRLIVNGASELSKIEARRTKNTAERYAMRSQRKARWGMKVSLAGIPVSR